MNNMIGSIISGTMRQDDLIPAFLDELEILDEAQHDALCEEVAGILWRNGEDWDDDEICMFLNEDLWDAMMDHAPEFCYFGAHPGDGSDYGFWVDHDGLAESIRYGYEDEATRHRAIVFALDNDIMDEVLDDVAWSVAWDKPRRDDHVATDHVDDEEEVYALAA